MDPPRLLLIDSYDSFTFNLANLVRRSIPGADVHIIRNDQYQFEDILPHLHGFSAIIIGPGPGSPTNSSDVGIIRRIWSLPENHLLPVFGVCLGMQSLCVEHGGTLRRLEVVKHGQISRIHHANDDLFESAGRVDAVRYHSLHVTINDHATGDIRPLAWADDGAENGRILMAARHCTKPFWAVQYHPESICTTGSGVLVLQNFWKLASEWSAKWRNSSHTPIATRWKPPRLDRLADGLPLSTNSIPNPPQRAVSTIQTPYSGLSVPQIYELLGLTNQTGRSTLLESVASPGRYSIIGVPTSTSPILSFTCGQSFIVVRTEEGHLTRHDLHGLTIWNWLSQFMSRHKAVGGLPESPFWGGLIGYTTYEAGIQTLDVPLLTRPSTHSKPDVHFAFVERSVVVDHTSSIIYIQSLLENDTRWLESTRRLFLHAMDAAFTPAASPRPSRGLASGGLLAPKVTMPNKQRYLDKICRAKEYLAEGQSYELCVTAQTEIILESVPQPSSGRDWTGWELYKTLRRRNPAPHSCYIHLGEATLVGSSPERFLSWTREGKCQLRPIKGTVRKTPEMTLEIATALLNTPKEIAENLMIVDLIRHDLYGIAEDDAVQVPTLFQVEEYETVYQLVSVIEGQVDFAHGLTGIDVLSKVLPPGSMTGAPKKRSVQLLQDLEDEERQLYSGVHGYWCAGGAGDFAVTIRSAFRHDFGPELDPSALERRETWRIGAGGAITALSDPEAEWDEMETKLTSTLQAFVDI